MGGGVGGSSGGAGGSSGGMGGMGGGGGSGGGAVALASIRWVTPDGGATSSAMLPLVVELQPAAFDAGMGVAYSVIPPSGAASTGVLTSQGGGRFGGANTPTLMDGTWTAYASAGGLDASVRFEVDRTAPVVQLIVEPAPTRVADAGFSEIDPAAGFDVAWKKNEVAELKVLASEPVTVGPGSFMGVPSAALSGRTCSSACDAGRCTCFGLDLTQVTIPAPGFRGDAAVSLNAVADRVGLMSNTSMTTVTVTRWKWKRLIASGATALHMPALHTTGDLFVGAQLSSNTGTIVGLAPTGAERFAPRSSYGAVTTAPVMGRSLYVATKDMSLGQVRQLDPTTGAELNTACANASKNFDSPMAVADLTATDDRVVAMSRSGVLSPARPTAAANNCPELGGFMSPASGRRYVAVTNDLHTFLGNNFNATLTRVSWSAGSTAWGTASTNSPTLFTEGLTLFGTTLGGGGGLTTGGVFAMKSDNSNFMLPLPTTSIRSGGSAEATGPTIIGTATAPTFIYGNGPELVRVPYTPGDPGVFGSATTAVQQSGQSISTQPVAGEGGRIYVVDAMGTVSAYSSDLQTLQWRLTSGASGINGSVDSAANIDVARMGTMKDCSKPGTLYVPSTGDGSLYAFIVDSKGIDGTAPWPRFQHDPRNSGNPTMSLAEFTCP